MATCEKKLRFLSQKISRLEQHHRQQLDHLQRQDQQPHHNQHEESSQDELSFWLDLLEILEQSNRFHLEALHVDQQQPQQPQPQDLLEQRSDMDAEHGNKVNCFWCNLGWLTIHHCGRFVRENTKRSSTLDRISLCCHPPPPRSSRDN